MLDRFLGGPSGSLTGTPNQQFVEQAYLDMLGRFADTNGLAVWSGLLDQGQATRAQVALSIEGSPESHELVVERSLCKYCTGRSTRRLKQA